MFEGLVNKYALLIGVGEFRTHISSQTYTTTKDIQALKSALTESCGYINDGKHIKLLQDQEATKKAILDELDWLENQTKNNSADTVFIYYSGHGGLVDSTQEYYLIPHDTVLLAATFNQALGQIKAKKLLVVIDSCHAGGIAKAKKDFIQKPFPAEKLIEELKTNQLEGGEGRAVFTSSTKDQESIFDPSKEMSIYTFHFIEALKGKGNAPGDEKVSVSNLMNYVGKTVLKSAEKLGRKQTPFFDLKGEDFPVALLRERKSFSFHNREEEDPYVEPPVLQSCYNEILKPGCLLRIKAPWKMGKTSLMSKIVNYAVANYGYRMTFVRLRLAEPRAFENLEKFLQWFCISASQGLKLRSEVDERWNQTQGNMVNCQNYFEDYLLQGDKPLVLCLDDVDKIFPYDDIAKNFLSLMRAFHEEAKTSQSWEQLRLVMAYTEAYSKVENTKSPFNVGTEINSTYLELRQEEVQKFVQTHGLSLDMAQVEQLMNMVGGHPYLVQEIIKEMKFTNKTLENVLQEATRQHEIYEYLEQYRKKLREHPEPEAFFKKVVMADKPVKLYSELDSGQMEKLNNLGLVKLQSNNDVIPRYELYRQYFRDCFRGIE
jgi:hypothetical protein